MSKQPKPLTRNQKELLSRIGLNWKEWSLMKEMETKLILIHKQTGRIKAVNKNA